jgi:hypothetical protein
LRKAKRRQTGSDDTEKTHHLHPPIVAAATPQINVNVAARAHAHHAARITRATPGRFRSAISAALVRRLAAAVQLTTVCQRRAMRSGGRPLTEQSPTGQPTIRLATADGRRASLAGNVRVGAPVAS